ncbi:hypothetical protein MRB53_009259 [Persea americana]|uniref:Uncharacterized protein n=1 Tax=Persea americana TaxID=3435 RepID=A0ACC2LNI2_PERAE|nr:hypothetical protein MRB53_009259 [Persea americana]
MGKWDGEGGVGSGGGKGDFEGHAGRATREGGDSFAGGDRDGAGSRTCNGKDELGHCLCWAEISEGRGEDLQSVRKRNPFHSNPYPIPLSPSPSSLLFLPIPVQKPSPFPHHRLLSWPSDPRISFACRRSQPLKFTAQFTMAAKSENEQSIAEVPRRRRKKSLVWEHFTVEAVAGGCARACCKRCKQTFAYSTGTKVLGTSHLKRHLARGTCPKNQLLQEKGQLTPYTPASKTDGSASEQPKKRYRGSASFHQGIVFDQDQKQLSGKNTVAPNGQFYIASCFAHILNITVQEGLRAIHEIIYVVRESIKYVKASQAHEDKFAEIAEQLQINSTKMLSLDVQTQWNTTYQMLVSALEYKEAFFYLGSCDPNYSQSLSVDEWKKVDALCKYLKVLYDAANVFKGMTNPTSNMYFHEAWKIKLELSHAATSEDVFVSTVIKPMHEKFDKYWKDCSLILAIAVVMDPRFKMKLIEFSFSKIYGETAGDNIKIIDEGIHELYLEYIAQPLPLTPAYEEQGATPNAVEGTLLCSNDGLLDFDVYISETASNQQTKSELDQYLEEAVLPRISDVPKPEIGRFFPSNAFLANSYDVKKNKAISQ